jgi:magnesium-transporting ATPase (P-type)
MPEPIAQTSNDPAWHSLSVEQVLGTVESNESGLTAQEARRRLETYGPNVLARQSGDGPLQLLWRQINSPLIWVLLGSAVVAIALGKVTDGAVVLAVVVVNTIIGFAQEYRAGKAIEALADMVPEYTAVSKWGPA